MKILLALKKFTIIIFGMKLLPETFNKNKGKYVRILHSILSFLDDSFTPTINEVRIRKFGKETSSALKKLKQGLNLPAADTLDKRTIARINQEVLNRMMTSRSQLTKLHGKLKKALAIAKIKCSLETDIKMKIFEKESKTALDLLQEKYKLKKTGVLDRSTLELLESIVASRPVEVKKLKVASTEQLSKIRNPIRLNMKKSRVADLQKALTWLGYRIDNKEHTQLTYGRTTQKAVIDFQKKNGLPITGNVGWKTKTKLNELIASNSRMVSCKDKYRVRGCVRDELWKGIPHLLVQVLEKGFKNERLLAERKTLGNGFFDIQYLPPVDDRTGKAKKNFQLIIRALIDDKKLFREKHFQVSGKLLWANFTFSSDKYMGISDFTRIKKAIHTIIGKKMSITELKENTSSQDITYIRKQVGISTEDIMKIIFSFRVAAQVNRKELTPEVFYAFIRQNTPRSLPDSFLPDRLDEWDSWIKYLDTSLTNDIIYMDKKLQQDIIQSALKQNYISRPVIAQFNTILNGLEKAKTDALLSQPLLNGCGSVGTLLKFSSIKEPHYEAVAQQLNKTKQFNANFWETLGSLPGITKKDVDSFKATTYIGHIVSHHEKTLSFLTKRINNSGNGEIAPKIGEFATFGQTEWLNIIKENENSIPSWVEGSTSVQKRKNYAELLKANSEDLFPTIAIVSEIRRSENHALGNMTNIQAAVLAIPEFNIIRDSIQTLYETSGIEFNENERAAVKAIQRVSRVAQNGLTARILLESGYYSAAQIYRQGKHKLISTLSSKGIAEKVCARIYYIAEGQYSVMMAALAKYNLKFQYISPGCILKRLYNQSEIDELKKQIPDIETLFGPLESREVKHCESVLGPSAYLVDIFRFLSEKNSKLYNKSAKDILFQRRPDLGTIKLNCINTDTPLPYIDLVCEILENRVINGTGELHFQSTRSAQELEAEPEHIVSAAYETVKNSLFPIFGGFNLWQEESRAFLAHLGVPRYLLMKTFLQNTSSAVEIKNKADIAGEFFNLSAQEQKIVTTPHPMGTWQKKFWGNNGYGTFIYVALFLKKTDITYDQLFELLQCSFVNSDEPLSTIVSPGEDVSIETQKVSHTDIPRLDRFNRFIRLWKTTGMTLWELDLLLMSPHIGKGSLDNNFLIALHSFEMLRQTLKLSVEQLLCFWQDINCDQRFTVKEPDIPGKTLYHKQFLSGSIDDQVSAAFSELLNINTTTKNLGDYRDHLLSSLSLDTDSLDILIAKTDGKLTRASLSLLVRYTLFARQLQLSVSDLCEFLELIDIDNPFTSLSVTQSVVDIKKHVDDMKIKIPELQYLHNYLEDSPVSWREKAYTQIILSLRESRAGLRDAMLESEATGEDSLAMLLSRVEPFSDTSLHNTAMDIIAGTWSTPAAEINLFIETHFSSFISHIDRAKNILAYTAPVPPAELVTRKNYVSTELINYLNQTAIKEIISTSFSIQSVHTDLLLQHLHLPGKISILLTELNNNILYERNENGDYLNEISMATMEDLYITLRLIHKASLIIKGLALNHQELEWAIQNSASLSILDFNLLPVKAAQSKIPFIRFLTFWRLIRCKRNFPVGENNSFFTILDIASHPSSSAALINKTICDLTEWNYNEQMLLHYSGLDYLLPATYEWFLECYKIRKKTGAGFQALFSYANKNSADLEQQKAREIRDLVKAKYSDSTWFAPVKSVMDVIREKKRHALTVFLMEQSQRTKPPTVNISGKDIKNPQYWWDTNDMYSWFLIDVEMCSEQKTSRIKQAISSSQLFIQRCFLNLELDVQVALPDPDQENNWNQWKWMKHYRIWEAHRKVFLYPENWIEPELRHEKSELFEELESDLLSKELTNESAEEALQRYIHKLEGIAHLKVCSVYHQHNQEEDLLHIIACTKDIPPVYYYRHYNLLYGKWSPWERIEVDINSDHVIPVVYNRKLYIFWLMFQEKPVKLKKMPPVQPSDKPVDSPEPAKMLLIELAWSYRTKDGWVAKSFSKQKLLHPWERPAFSYNIKPRYKKLDNTLWIDIYISTSKEFNNARFYDQFSASHERLTKVYYDETLRPWHSSSFVFDGNVREVLLRGIPGFYFSPEIQDKRNMTSYEYIKENFEEQGRNIHELKVISEQLSLPAGMHYSFTRLSNNQNQGINDNKFTIFDSNRHDVILLHEAQNPFEAVLCQQGLTPVDEKIRPAFYQDSSRSFFILQERTFIQYIINTIWSMDSSIYAMRPFYHPFADMFQQEINRGGINHFYKRTIQITPQSYSHNEAFNFTTKYAPITTIDVSTAETEMIDFSRSGAYSIYNWELFFHIPMLIANRLHQNQRFEEAMNWYHYIFDPTNTQSLPIPQRYWVTKPLYETTSEEYRKQRIQYIIEHIDRFREQLMEWKNHPFRPHLIAEHRTVAYQKAIVMKYIDNIIDWGDRLFGQDTMESINEATQLYVLAMELLGDKPVMIPAIHRADKTYNELEAEGNIDEFGNSIIEVNLENVMGLPIEYSTTGPLDPEPLPTLELSYFGLPHNDILLTYWDVVADRLFKIRHSMNIKGVKRQLALFAPPIDPALLVKAAAAGIDPSNLLDAVSTTPQTYRFKVLVKKALELCRDVSRLGISLLHVLEKRDAEELAQLRASNEKTILSSLVDIRKQYIKEAAYEVEAYKHLQEACQIKIDHIDSLNEKLEEEKKAGDWGTAATVFNVAAKVSTGAAAVVAWLFDVDVGAAGAGGTPKSTVKTGGSKAKDVLEKIAKGLEIAGKICKWRQDSLKSEAKSKRTKAEREALKQETLSHQQEYNKLELASGIRRLIAEKNLENLEKEIELKEAENEYLKSKYTNVHLYQWMLSQISTVYFQAYQLAYEMAKRAEKSYQRERGLEDSNYIQFGYWDSLKKGLLSADRLCQDIHRMESAYYENNRRQLEITKHASLAHLSPMKFVELILTGRCNFKLEEWMLNLDYPGHYSRRIKSVSMTIICNAHEYTNINCSLRLLNSRVRVNSNVENGYEQDDENDIRFVFYLGKGESIATSHCKKDYGMFTLDFDDERFLPFEGEGAISNWDIYMPREHNQFDYNTIYDVILHISYTALDGGESLATAAKTHLDSILPTMGAIVFPLKHLFPSKWESFLNPGEGNDEQILQFQIVKEHYPYLSRLKEYSIKKIDIAVEGLHTGDYVTKLTLSNSQEVTAVLVKEASLSNKHYKSEAFTGITGYTGEFSLKLQRDTAAPDDFSSLSVEEIGEIYLIIEYS